jgi:TolB-like protein
VKHHDRVVTKDELLDQVWSGRFISETTLSSRIKSVRQLIGDTGNRQALLRTFRNRGYRFVGDVSVQLENARALVAPASAAGPPRATGIAVLPFQTYGQEDESLHIGEGVAADIIALLARYRWLQVMARGSSFAFQADASPKEVGMSLGVKYLLTGRVRRFSDRIRIDAELVDCVSGQHLWGQAYNRDEGDLFSVIEVLVQHIAAAIEPELGAIERAGSDASPVGTMDTWGLYHRGMRHLYRFTAEDLEQARQWLARAAKAAPDFALAHSGLAYVAVQMAFYGTPLERDHELETALACARRAVALDPADGFNHFALGRALSLRLEFDEAAAELTSAVELTPSFAQGYFALGFCLTNAGQPEQAIPLFETAIRLSPRDPHLWTFQHMLAMAYLRLGQMSEAEHFVREAVRQPHATYWPFVTLCALLGMEDRLDEASAIRDRLLKMRPGYDLAAARDDFFFAPPDAFLEEYLRGLARAGIPD